MRRIYVGTAAIALALLVPVVYHAQGKRIKTSKDLCGRRWRHHRAAGWTGKVGAAISSRRDG